MAEDKSVAQEAQSKPGDQTGGSEPPHAKFSLRKFTPVIVFCLAGLILFGIASLWIPWTNSVSLKTDDAYVHADIAPLSTRERGIVSRILVHDYQKVTAGQTLVELRNEDFKDKENEAHQAVSETQIKIDDMASRKAKLDAQILEARAALSNSHDAFAQFDATIAINKAAIAEAKANLTASNEAKNQAEAAVESAQADVVKTEKAKKREENLLAEESSTNEKVEQVVDEYERAKAGARNQQAALARAKAECLAKKAQVMRAEQQLASTLVDQKRAAANVDGRDAQVTAVTMERKLLDGEEAQLKTALVSKKSASDVASVDLGYTTIKSPANGVIGELKVKPGQFVNAGTNVVTLVSATPWVIANFREMQTAKIKVGDKANIDIDAISGRHWKGHVESIAPASGAQFSLLPPDNASGNFTKITQRIPVKLVFEDNQENFEAIKPGMSANVGIEH